MVAWSCRTGTGSRVADGIGIEVVGIGSLGSLGQTAGAAGLSICKECTIFNRD